MPSDIGGGNEVFVLKIPRHERAEFQFEARTPKKNWVAGRPAK